tara:strand:- start:15694 stop:16800 length:1107 start_codon:yes stop_codon:yes gene_type:complete
MVDSVFPFGSLDRSNMAGLVSESNLQEELLEIVSKHHDPQKPLPSTRKLADHFGVSHVTVAKALLTLSERGAMFKGENGRYFSNRMPPPSELSKPVTCFLRSINSWAGWYPELMEGIGRACEESGRGLLIYPVSQLLEQEAPDIVPTLLADDRQRELLKALLLRASPDGGRLILDDLWSDAVLEEFSDELDGARVLLRSCSVSGLVEIVPNFSQGAFLAFTHLLGCGFEKIWVVRPFSGVGAIDESIEAFEAVFRASGIDHSRFRVIDIDRDNGLAHLAGKLGKESGRIGVYCPEENFALSLYRELENFGIQVPQSVGLLAGWGTGAIASKGLSALHLDLKALGRIAVEGDEASMVPFEFSMKIGSST